MRVWTAALLTCASVAAAEAPLPFDIGGEFELTNQYGERRTEADPDGHAQLLFFGYANCPNICSAALPDMAGVVDLLKEEGVKITPVMITVAPEQDQIETMGAPLGEIHPDFIGLTGDETELAVAYAAFSVEVEPIFQDPEYGWIYAHGSFIHLLDADGKTLTLFPPILGAEKSAEIVRRYLLADGA
jgi:protein SCO1/2